MQKYYPTRLFLSFRSKRENRRRIFYGDTPVGSVHSVLARCGGGGGGNNSKLGLVARSLQKPPLSSAVRLSGERRRSRFEFDAAHTDERVKVKRPTDPSDDTRSPR